MTQKKHVTRQPEPNTIQKNLAQPQTKRQGFLQRATDPSYPPFRAQLLGHHVPPWLRLSPLPQTIEETQTQHEFEGARQQQSPQMIQQKPFSGTEASPTQRKETKPVPFRDNTVPSWLRLSTPPQKAQETKPALEPVQRKENATGLPDTLKTGVETLSGLSLDDVQVHYHSSKPAEVQALAYTQGTDIYVGPGQEQHLAHETWHVVQQKQSRVEPTIQAKGMGINDNQALEREADIMGMKAVQRVLPTQAITLQQNQSSSSDAPVQMEGGDSFLEGLYQLARSLGINLTGSVETVGEAIFLATGIPYETLQTLFITLGAITFASYVLYHYYYHTPVKKDIKEGEAKSEISGNLLAQSPTISQGNATLISSQITLPIPQTVLPAPQPVLPIPQPVPLAPQSVLPTPNTVHLPPTALDLAIQNNRERNKNYFGLLTDSKRGRTPAQLPAYRFDDSSTWILQPPVFRDSVTSTEVQSVILTDTDQTYYNDILNGVRTNNASTGTAVVGARYHTHMGGNGGGGLAFYYEHTGGNNVQPVIYAVAYSRNGNVYVWRHNKGNSNTAP